VWLTADALVLTTVPCNVRNPLRFVKVRISISTMYQSQSSSLNFPDCKVSEGPRIDIHYAPFSNVAGVSPLRLPSTGLLLEAVYKKSRHVGGGLRHYRPRIRRLSVLRLLVTKKPASIPDLSLLLFVKTQPPLRPACCKHEA
jgi:hypothetical protein